MLSGNPRQMRELGLRRLLLAKRWILAGSVALTGVLAGVAANAFPGKTIATATSKAPSERHPGETSSPAESSGEGSSESLTPAQAPPSSEAREPEQGSSQPSETPVISGGS